MADKFPNLPGIIVDVRDGNLSPDITANGPTVVVLGTATKGPAKVESRLVSPATSLSRFGIEGTLGRGLIEVFQGGANNATGYRVLTTTSKIEHIGDATGAAGYTVESVVEGADALTKFSVFYDNGNDLLKVYNAANGDLVYSNDPDAPVDLGVVIVTGEKATSNPHGSIGKTVKVRTTEADQTAARSSATTMTMPLGNNLALLQWNADKNPFVAQIRSALVDRPAALAAVKLATTAPLSACTAVGTTTLTVDAAEVLTIDGVAVALNDRVLVKDQVLAENNGIYKLTVVGTVGPDVLWELTRVTDLDGDDEFEAMVNVSVTHGVANAGKKFVLTTSGPYTVGTTALTFAEYDSTATAHLIEDVVSDINLVDRIFTLETADKIAATAFPAGLQHDVRFISNKYAQRADKILTDRLFISSSPLLVTPGSNFNGLPKALNNWGWAAEVDDSAGELTVAEVEPAKMNMYEAMEDAFAALEASDVDILVVPSVYLDDPALDGETSGATALPTTEFDVASVATVAGAANYCTMTFTDRTARLAAETALTAAGRGGCWAVFDELQGTAFGNNIEEGYLVRTARILNWEVLGDEGTSSSLTVHFDRDVSFSLDAVDGAVVVAQNPSVLIYKTDLLFYHRAVELEGKLLHMWYPESTDPDGYTYHEVNFAYSMARFCGDMTENENSAIAVIGVRPPANHFNPAAIATWIGKSPSFDDEGLIIADGNGSGLLGNKFISGKLMESGDQFYPGFKATESGELDDDNIVVDGNGFDVDLGKFLSIVASWPIISNIADSTGLGYINSSAALYAGLLANLPVWRGATAKLIGGRGIRVPVKLAKRHQNSLVGQRYVILDQRTEGVIVVDAPSAALPTSDFTRNMTVRLVGEAVRACREASRPFLGDPLSAIRRAALETTIKKTMSDLQRQTGGALESFESSLSQTALDKIRGTARLTLTMKVINELRRITVNVALSL